MTPAVKNQLPSDFMSAMQYCQLSVISSVLSVVFVSDNVLSCYKKTLKTREV